MKFVFSAPIVCKSDPNSTNACQANIISKLEAIVGSKLEALSDTDKMEGHISFYHRSGNHVIWLLLYDNNNVHEREDEIITIISDNPQNPFFTIEHKLTKTTGQMRCKKFTGTVPTQQQLEAIIF